MKSLHVVSFNYRGTRVLNIGSSGYMIALGVHVCVHKKLKSRKLGDLSYLKLESIDLNMPVLMKTPVNL